MAGAVVYPHALPFIFAVISILTYGSEALRLPTPPVQNETSKDDLLWPGLFKADMETFKEVMKLPEALRGQRLVFIGDSNDRNFLQHLSSQHEAKGHQINVLNGGLKFTGELAVLEFNFENHDLVANFVWHGGVMSIPPQPSWHANQLQGGTKWRQGVIPKYENGTAVVSSIEIAHAALEHFAYADKRPIIVVLQSSLWDSVLAKEAKVSNKYRDAAEAFEDWDWVGKASQLVRAVEKNSRIEQLYWRTNPNCPFSTKKGTHTSDNYWIDSVTEKQAAAIRNAVRQRVSPWDKIGLIDWRQDYIATDCEGIHYRSEGYEDLFEHLKHALAGKI